MHYFAYGSNTHTNRLQARVSSAVFVTVASLPGYQLKFNKRSKDGSGKGNIEKSANPMANVFGVLWQISPDDLKKLDKIEGLGFGYHSEVVAVIGKADNRDLPEEINALTYVGDKHYLDDKLLPYHWYKNYVEGGAKQHHLPATYVIEIEQVKSFDDPDIERAEHNRKIINGKPGIRALGSP